MPKTIFVIDDEPEVREGMEFWLEEYGYRVVTAEGGPEGLEKLKFFSPHLILLDIIMPEMDGFEVLSRLKKNFRTSTIPVIMLTAKGETRSIIDAKELMAVDYVTKPFDADELLKLIRRYEQ